MDPKALTSSHFIFRMIHTELVEFGRHKLGENETVVLRWQFDILPQDMDICFSLVRGRCHDSHSFNETDFIIRDRLVTGGAGGENEGIFTVNNTCTLIFSNEKAWVRYVPMPHVFLFFFFFL
jgi:hypothetical protein